MTTFKFTLVTQSLPCQWPVQIEANIRCFFFCQKNVKKVSKTYQIICPEARGGTKHLSVSCLSKGASYIIMYSLLKG